MPDIQITDDLGNAIPEVKLNPTSPSSLLKYAKHELMHFAVLPEFKKLAPELLSAAAKDPISFGLTAKHQFKLGNTKPEIDLTPSFKAQLQANAKRASNLFDKDVFPVVATVPDNVGYVSMALQGGLDLGVSGSAGDLTFGFDANSTIDLEYWKAFPLGAGEPTLGEAAGETISGFVIGADIEDLKLLSLYDICTVSGQGSLKISAGFQVSAVPNPLASVALPLNAGTVQVKAGVMAGVSASFAITGSYQIRARRTSADAIELSVYKEQGTTLKVDLTASAGVSVMAGDTDLVKSLVNAISTDPNDDATKKLFTDGGLSKDEIATLNGAIKDGVDHSLAASLDLALSQVTDHEAAFQYEIRPAQLSQEASAAVHRALEGDLSVLTALETGQEGAVLAPGVKLLSSVLTTLHKTQTTLKLNLLGLVNFISVSALIRKSVVVKDPGTGYLTIADSATGNRINAETQMHGRRNALHKAMFESMIVTAAYRVSNTVNMPGLSGHSFHFAANDTTNAALVADYLNWFVLANLLSPQQKNQYAGSSTGRGPSTCLLRIEFDAGACESMFFESPGGLWKIGHYLEIGRGVMRGLINPNNNRTDRLRYELLDQHWDEVLNVRVSNKLGPLVGVQLTDADFNQITPYLIGDVATIFWWADAMVKGGEAALEMRQFLSHADPATLVGSHEFADRRDRLQKTMAGLIGKSQTRFDEPWGLIALYWAAGSKGASAKLVNSGVILQKPDLAIGAGR